MSDAFWMGQQPYDPTQANRDAIVQAILAQQDAQQGGGMQMASLGGMGGGMGQDTRSLGGMLGVPNY